MLGETITIIGIPIIRNIAGWLNRSLEDGKIQKYEVKELVKTIVSMSITGAVFYFGLSKMGINGAAMGAAAGAWLVDKLM